MTVKLEQVGDLVIVGIDGEYVGVEIDVGGMVEEHPEGKSRTQG